MSGRRKFNEKKVKF